MVRQRVYIDGKKCILLVHDGTLFSSLTLNVGVGLLRPIAGYVYSQIVQALESEGFPPDALGDVDYRQIRLARTRSRSLLGSMNDMVIMARHVILRHLGRPRAVRRGLPETTFCTTRPTGHAAS